MGLFNQPVFRHFLICVSCPKLQILIWFYAENDQSNFQALIFNRFWCIHVQKIPRYERTCWKYLMEYFDILAIIVYVITFFGKSSRSTTVIWHRMTHLFYSKRGSACTSIFSSDWLPLTNQKGFHLVTLPIFYTWHCTGSAWQNIVKSIISPL